MRFRRSIIPFAFLILVFNACKKAEIPDPIIPQPPTENIGLIITSSGVPSGNSNSAIIGAAGGSITSFDGSLTVTIPAGALTADTEINIQPITNTAPLGIANAYRLGPEGTTFDVPVTLSFNYLDEDISNFPEELLWIVTQKSDGSWLGCRRLDPDPAQNRIHVNTTHFSDWGFGKFVDLRLNPATATVIKGHSVALQLAGFRSTGGVDDDLVPLYPINTNNGDLEPLVPILPDDSKLTGFQITGWTLNGVNAPTSGSNGSLTQNGLTANYTAPNQIPNPNPVAVSVYLKANNYLGGISTFIINSSINVREDGYYLTLNVNGSSYTFYEWGLNGQIPPNPNHQWLVNAGYSGGSFGITATELVNGSLGEVWFVIDYNNPQVGNKLLHGFHDNGVDGVSLSLSSLAGQYELNYTERHLSNQVCNHLDKSGLFYVNLSQFDLSSHTAEGSFNGSIYYDSPLNQDNCETSDEMTVSGDFYLYVSF